MEELEFIIEACEESMTNAVKHLERELAIWSCEIQHQYSQGEDTTAEKKIFMAYTKAIKEINSAYRKRKEK